MKIDYAMLKHNNKLILKIVCKILVVLIILLLFFNDDRIAGSVMVSCRIVVPVTRVRFPASEFFFFFF